MTGGSRLYAWAVVATAVAVYAAWVLAGDPTWPSLGLILFWGLLLFAAELLPVALGFSTSITMGFPVLLATAILFEPSVAMTIAALGSFDPRELRGEISLHRALFNRAQVMLAVGAASTVFDVSTDPFVPWVVLIAAASHLIVNLGLVSGAIHFDREIGFLEALKRIPPRPLAGFFLSTVLLAALGAATARAYLEIESGGEWVVIAILIPLLFARMTIQGAKAQQELSERVRKQQEALLVASENVFQEREQERARIAESIHDTSLQMLAAASYGCSNTAELINAGKIDAASQTLKTAQTAVADAIAGLREALIDLRRSAVEEGGLMETVQKFADQLSTLWGARIVVEGGVQNEPPTPVALAAFQILQEGLVNALKHSRSESVTVSLEQTNGMLHIAVQDQGIGFDDEPASREGHLGMRLMRERAEGVGGRIELRSEPGRGTRVEAVLPAGVPAA